MTRSDAEIGREAFAMLWESIWGENFDPGATIEDQKVAVVQYIREAVRGDIEREVIERLIAEARKIGNDSLHLTQESGLDYDDDNIPPLYFACDDRYYSGTCAGGVVSWLKVKLQNTPETPEYP